LLPHGQINEHTSSRRRIPRGITSLRILDVNETGTRDSSFSSSKETRLRDFFCRDELFQYGPPLPSQTGELFQQPINPLGIDDRPPTATDYARCPTRSLSPFATKNVMALHPPGPLNFSAASVDRLELAQVMTTKPPPRSKVPKPHRLRSTQLPKRPSEEVRLESYATRSRAARPIKTSLASGVLWAAAKSPLAPPGIINGHRAICSGPTRQRRSGFCRPNRLAPPLPYPRTAMIPRPPADQPRRNLSGNCHVIFSSQSNVGGKTSTHSPANRLTDSLQTGLARP